MLPQSVKDAKSNRGSLCFLCMTDLPHIFQASQKRGKDLSINERPTSSCFGRRGK